MRLFPKDKLELKCSKMAPGKCEAIRKLAVDVNETHYGLSEADLSYIIEAFPSIVQMENDRRMNRPRQASPSRSQWTPDKPSRGLGDTIAKVTGKMGIKPCGGCKKRQKKLNKLIAY